MRFLFFEMRTVCYNSYLYFADALSLELKKRGHAIEKFNLQESGLDGLENYIGQTYDALIDFNSELPRALTDDDSYFLDHVSAPFFDIILDHPLYHHDSLKHKIKNFNVICLDNNHKKYIEKYYQHIKSVTAFPMTGELAFAQEKIDWRGWDARTIDILFSGTYTDPMRVETSIHRAPKFMEETTHRLIDMMLKEPALTIEDAVGRLSENEIYDYINSDLPTHTQSFYLADAYIRCVNRKNLVLALDKCRHDVHLYGSLWEELDLKHAIIHKEVPFNFTFTLFMKTKLSVNIMPNFKAGAHDRVFSSQLNGAAVLSDETLLLKNEYTDKENILFFDLTDMGAVTEIADSAIDKPESLMKIAMNGNTIAKQWHTWSNVCDVFLSALAALG